MCLLAGVAVLEGLGAAVALGVAREQVERGRVASDIRTAFVELSATKQRLRTWVAQRQQGAGADPEVREALQRDMRHTLERLQTLSASAIQLDRSADTRAEHLRRQIEHCRMLGVSGFSLFHADSPAGVDREWWSVIAKLCSSPATPPHRALRPAGA